MARRISSPVFIGREAELERVADLRAEGSAGGTGATVIVLGEAGIGKSRFCAEIVARAAGDGWTTLHGACDEFGGEARPLSVLVAMLPALEQALTEDLPEELSGYAWTAIMSLRFPDLTAARVQSGSVIELVQGLFQRLASVRPVLVVLDDLHWADESSRLMFESLSRGLRHSPTLLIGAYRDDEVVRDHPLHRVLASIHRNGTPEVLELKPMMLSEAETIARSISGGRTPPGFDDLFVRSGGNAFFIEELLAAAPGALPLGAREMVLARLSSLSLDAVRLAEMAALDSRMQREVLAEVWPLDRETFAAAFDHLTASGFLVQQGDGYGYRHPLIREIVQESIPPGRLPELHRHFALALEAVTPHRAPEIARHWRQSPDRERALVTAIAAAEHAFRVGAMPESADWYDVAFELWPTVPLPEELTGVSLAGLVNQSDDSFTNCRRFTPIVRRLEEILHNPAGLSSAEIASCWMTLCLRCWQDSGDEGITLPRAFECLQNARAAMDDVPEPERVELLCSYVVFAVLLYGLDEEAALALQSVNAITEAERLPAKPYVVVANDCVRATRGEGTVDYHVSPQAKGTPLFVRGQTIRIGLTQRLGLHEITVDRALEAIDIAKRLGRLWVDGFEIESNLARSLAALGRWEEARKRFAALRASLQPTAFSEWGTLVTHGWGALLVRSGHVDDAIPPFEDSSRWVVPYGMDQFYGSLALTGVELARFNGDKAACRRAISEPLAVARGHYVARCGEALAFAIAMEADCAFECHQLESDAIALVDGWIRRLRSCLVGAPARVRIDDLGMFIDQALAERARLSGEDCVATWEDLAERWHALPRPYHEAYARYRAAFALLMAPAASSRKESREQAARHLQIALAISQEIGAVFLEADVLRLRRTAGLRSRATDVLLSKVLSPQSSALAPSPALTSREMEVLRLLVVGESNGQIAAHLGISVKTASAHVSNIIHKLGAENRVEAAVRATRRGLVSAVAQDR